MRIPDPVGRGPALIPVAEYVRMSTDIQIHSPVNQSMAIAAYAHEHGMRVVRSYLDEGRSGLDFQGRDALQRLITDVQSGYAGFEAILVFDVSRWGRFQNLDEAAYYEFVCTQAGIRVCYVAELFDNDGSPLAMILKGLKRTMAAEFSRELSGKVYAGQCRLTQMGYRQGGFSGYGVRRMLVDAEGRRKGILQFGQRKSISSDRVILVPGPAHEVAVIRRIFREYVSGRQLREIATRLNTEGIANFLGRPWVYGAIRRILLNEKYIGNNVFSRCSKKLRQRTVDNPPSTWVRKDAAFQGIVSHEMFHNAGERLRRPHTEPTDEQLLADARRILARDGRLSIQQINAEPGLMCSQYRRRFESMRLLYERVGYREHVDLSFVPAKRRMRGWRESLTSFIAEIITDSGSYVRRQGWVLEVDRTWTVTVVLLPASHYKGHPRWLARHATMDTDVVVFARMAFGGSAPLDYLVLPRIAHAGGPIIVHETNRPCFAAYIFPSLSVLVDLARSSSSGCVSCG